MVLWERLLYRLARKWIAGKTMLEALSAAKATNEKGMGAILNYLGEEINDRSVAESHFKEYLELQNKIAGERVNGFVSVKLTQLGLTLDSNETVERLERLAINAERLGQLLYVDMEGYEYFNKTIEVFCIVQERHNNIGIAYQSYLRRGEEQFKKLLEKGAMIRLVKGAYRESNEIIYGSKDEIRKNYLKLMKILFESANNFAIATHDSLLINEARKLAERYNPKFHFEFLRGIRDDLKVELVKLGYGVFDYIPYGEEWYHYSMRRISEHPSNIILLLRSLL